MRITGSNYVHLKNWENAAATASNLSELEMTLGEVAGAVGAAEQSVTYADRSGVAWLRIGRRVALANARHHLGLFEEARAGFAEAETIFKSQTSDSDCLVGAWGVYYCDLLLASSERAAWQVVQKSAVSGQRSALIEECLAVSQRAAKMLQWAERTDAALLETALDHLTLGRAALYAAILERGAALRAAATPNGPAAADSTDAHSAAEPAAGHRPTLQDARRDLDAAVAGLRRAGQAQELPHGLLTRAWLRFLTGAHTGPESAQEDLDEAWEIAERGPMKLFLADIHLYRARLFGCETLYPWESRHADLAEARRLIEKCGYGRRKEELEDAEAGLRQHHS
jgi:hypothetical protein